MAKDFGGSSIDKGLYEWILNNIEEGKTILEFGSGNGSTGNLSKHYSMISIEHDSKWIGKHPSKYIWAPIVPAYNWYDTTIIKRHLANKTYDMILVDGPVGEGNRWGFLENIEMFNTNVPIIIDDIHRNAELDMFRQIAEKLNKEYKQLGENWGVIL